MLNVGIDIGGTKTNIGLVDDRGRVLFSEKMPTQADDPQGLAWQAKATVERLCGRAGVSMEDIHFIGAGVPGTVDIQTGLVSYCPNIKWFDVPMGEYLHQAFERRVVISQDSRNGALAEKTFGAGKPYTDLICITIGTGIGCGIILGGKVFHGAQNTAGELGHTPIAKNGPECLCGNRGCLERYACGTAIFERAFAQYPDAFEGREKRCEAVFDLAYEGDSRMLKLIEESMDDLAFAIANAVSLLSPQAIIISGGLCVHEALVVKPLKEKIYAHGYYSWTRLNQLQVHLALLGSDAPMIGASILYMG